MMVLAASGKHWKIVLLLMIVFAVGFAVGAWLAKENRI